MRHCSCTQWPVSKTNFFHWPFFLLLHHFLRVPWTSRRSNQSILKEINPEYSLEGLMLKLKLHYFGHSMRRANPLDCTMPGLPVHHQLQEFTQAHVHWFGDVIQSSHLCRPLLLLPSIFCSIRIFSNESILRIRWPKYWSFNFNISPSNEYSGLISFGME